ncbi:glycerol-3-phosphate 1-O-acyltransferase PlsB [Rheinheimera sp. UJ51]|uniref:glycerol-3-phosphate 1-O-acyltransferase PlsB n=1 Tax=Rheinheimera sp. UJ51 TaxID=2892446 RepID=UPI001E559C0E|nr:glycerol-3-phosphate 1-O-acyltransferase PlsB [Rheinheimera sp. UJ51]MCC5452183.1 glycerol-3-phosphate 1-O-acyltransferase PlsB [Rheinheimera sp. UJ51]
MPAYAAVVFLALFSLLGIIMFSSLSLLTLLLKWPIRLLVKFKIVPDNPLQQLGVSTERPLFYVCHTESASDVATLRRVCQQLALPDPLSHVELRGQKLSRILFLEKPHQIIGGRSETRALKQGQTLLAAHLANPKLQAQLMPISILWGRAPGKEDSIKWLLGEAHSPNWLAKLLIVFISGRHTLVRLSKPVDLQQMAGQFGAEASTARKLLRMSRIHFYRQRLAATGPKLMNRSQLFNALLATPAVKKAIADEAANRNGDYAAARQEARKLLQEIAADYRTSTLRFGDRILTWLWQKLYAGIKVNNVDTLRDLAQKGHEIVYVPCHRSHMDYLLLSYIIYHQGLVPPHIAAGINLNFWPAGTIFRRGGAFFIRRSFSGNKLYSTVFREYLSLLFMKGYAVKYYTEGGRSRTGRLLNPKTGMLAMTVQSMLRGIDRPVTLVPVYLGYEHVMEVNTYLSELQGSGKKKESVGGVLKAIRNLRDYGFGYVNFGEPISLNHYLTQQIPDWKSEINALEAPKPQWLNPLVAKLSEQIMRHINQAAALNSINLLSLALLASDKQAISRQELIQQLDCYLQLQQGAPYHSLVTLPHMSAADMIDHALQMKKIQVSRDSFGDVISLTPANTVLMSYYRNNILHLFIIPAILASAVLHQQQTSQSQLIRIAEQLYSLLRQELFLYVPSVGNYVKTILQQLTHQGLVKLDDEQYRAPSQHNREYVMLELLAHNAEHTLQRYAVVFNLLRAHGPLDRADLEQQSHQLAQRLLTLHGINAPEYYDKNLFATLSQALKQAGYTRLDQDNRVCATAELSTLSQTVNVLLRSDVLQSINSIMPKESRA